MNRRDTTLVIAVTVLWGLNFVVIDWGMAGVPPLLFVALRFTVVLLPAVFLIPRPRAPWRLVVAVGLTMSLGQFALLYLAIDAGLSPGIAALVLQAQVMLTVVLAAGTLRQVPTPRQGVGVAVGSAGLVVVALGRGGSTPALAVVLCLLAALSWAVGNVVSSTSGVAGGLSLTVWSALVVPLPALGLSLLLDGPAAVGAALSSLTWPAVVSTLYTAGAATLVGYGIFNGLLARNHASHVVPWVLLVPPVAITATWLLLGDAPDVAEVVGGSVMLGGVLVAARRRAPARLPAAAPAR